MRARSSLPGRGCGALAAMVYLRVVTALIVSVFVTFTTAITVGEARIVGGWLRCVRALLPFHTVTTLRGSSLYVCCHCCALQASLLPSLAWVLRSTDGYMRSASEGGGNTRIGVSHRRIESKSSLSSLVPPLVCPHCGPHFALVPHCLWDAAHDW